MTECELFGSRVSSLEMLDTMKEITRLTQRASDGTETAYVLGMAPTSVVAAAVTV